MDTATDSNNQSTKLIALFNQTDDGYYVPANELAKALCDFAKEEEVDEEQLTCLSKAGLAVEVGIPKYEYKTFKGGH